ncbi:sigma-70 family RNA polymerase sigma factor [Scytonema tolypothrichoides VB-61278]|nr:sigma-70 family RNA polymerase sigma factor [Scytonema tolypothrichoides VB-61278]
MPVWSRGWLTQLPAAHPRSDEEALVEAARHDARAFAPLYEHYVAAIYRYCYLRLNDVQAAEDATSDVFLKALAGISQQHGLFAAWLFRIAHNVVTDIYRRRRPNAPLDVATDLPNSAPLPQTLVEARAEIEALRAALALLPDEQRHVLELQLADWSGVQIAEALGKSTSAVKMLRYRALDKLRSLLQEDAPPTKEQ